MHTRKQPRNIGIGRVMRGCILRLTKAVHAHHIRKQHVSWIALQFWLIEFFKVLLYVLTHNVWKSPKKSYFTRLISNKTFFENTVWMTDWCKATNTSLLERTLKILLEFLEDTKPVQDTFEKYLYTDTFFEKVSRYRYFQDTLRKKYLDTDTRLSKILFGKSI